MCVCACKNVCVCRGGGVSDIVKCLVFAGADLDAREVAGCTPLHWAAHKGFAEIIEVCVCVFMCVY